MREYDPERDALAVSEQTVHSEIELSENHTVSKLGVHTEYEVHVGMAEVFYVLESATEAVAAKLDIDLEAVDFRAGCEIVVVPDKVIAQ